MALTNEHYLRLPGSYLFADVAKRVAAFKAENPERRVISLGIGDVTQPLAPAVIEAMHRAVDDLSRKETFHGYGPEHGYDFLREKIQKQDFEERGIHVALDEIFVDDGAKSSTGNIQELLRWDNSVALTDPVYPVYVDSNAMIGRSGKYVNGRWDALTYLPCTRENHFVPKLPTHRVDMIYLCYPNNPTGTTLSRHELEKWVKFALANDAIIFYDAAYEAFIQDPDIPHSIYEIPGARRCAIEFRSYSKRAGFTGVRCGYVVVPHDVTASSIISDERVELNHLWERHQTTKFNGASYISQRGAEAVYTPDGLKQTKETINYYLGNASIMRATLAKLGFEVFGGKNAPYIWVRTPDDMPSWQFFDQLLHRCGLVCTPGVGFGPSGEGYFRLTAFGNREDVEEAMERLKDF